MKMRLSAILFLVAFVVFGCDDNKSKDTNTQTGDNTETEGTNNQKYKLGEPCVRDEFIDTCVDSIYYITCDYWDKVIEKIKCTDVDFYDGCIQFEGESAKCYRKSDYEKCNSLEDDVYMCVDNWTWSGSALFHNTCKKNIVDNQLYRLADAKLYELPEYERCLGECTNSTSCFTMNEAEKIYSCENKNDGKHCAIVDDKNIAYLCVGGHLVSGEYIITCEDEMPYCNPDENASTIYGISCSNFNITDFDCKFKADGSYCNTVDGKGYVYSCTDGELLGTPDYCGIGNDCVVVEEKPMCLTTCSENELGQHDDICKYEYYENRTTYRQCEKIGDGYYYVKKGWDSCNGECNGDNTACLSIRCSPFYESRCSDEHTIKYCENEAINFKECDPNLYCVDTGGNYPSCLEKCSTETEQPVIRCECDEENTCGTMKYNCTQYGDSYYLEYDSIDEYCDGLCNADRTGCMD